MGSFVVMFFLIAVVLMWVILKDKDYQKGLAGSLAEMVENQKNYNEQYKRSQEYHRETVSMITEVLKTERDNTKECWRGVADNTQNMDKKVDELLNLVRSHGNV
jgi:hypothetical protein